MFVSSQRATGTGYTSTVTLLAIAFIFTPGALLLSRPIGYPSLLLAISCSGLCATLARLTWKKSSQLTIPSITVPNAEAK